MSRLAKNPIEIPAGVTVTVSGDTVVVKGAKGELSKTFRKEVSVEVKSGQYMNTEISCDTGIR